MPNVGRLLVMQISLLEHSLTLIIVQILMIMKLINLRTKVNTNQWNIPQKVVKGVRVKCPSNDHFTEVNYGHGF